MTDYDFRINSGGGLAFPAFDSDLLPAFLNGPEAAAAYDEWQALNAAAPAMEAAWRAAMTEAEAENPRSDWPSDTAGRAAWAHALETAVRGPFSAMEAHGRKSTAALRKYHALQRTEAAGRLNADDVIQEADAEAREAWATLRAALTKRSQASRFSKTWRSDGYVARGESDAAYVIERMAAIVEHGLMRRNAHGATFVEVTL